MNQKEYTIAVLDDHNLIAEAIESMLQKSEKYLFIKGFSNSKQLSSFLEADHVVQIVLLDIHLNGEDGIKVCKELSINYPEVRCIMLTSLTQQSLVLEAIKNGAKGYLPKNVGYEELITAFDTVVNGQLYLHKDLTFGPVEGKVNNDYVPKLTRRENEVLKLIMEEFTTSEISQKLCISINTVETHRASLLSKTGSKNVVGLIKFTLEKGLLSS